MSKQRQPNAQSPAAAKKSRKRVSPSRRRAASSTRRIRMSQRARPSELSPKKTETTVACSTAIRRPSSRKHPVAPIQEAENVNTTWSSIVEKFYLVGLLVFVMPIWLPLCWLASEAAE